MASEHVETTGSAAVPVTPDRVVLRLRVRRAENGVSAALDACARSVRTVLAALDDAAGEGHERQTTSIDVSRHWDDRRQRELGWEATQALVVRLDDPEQVGTVIGAVADAAGGRFVLDGLGWDCSDTADAEQQAREVAFAVASARAEQLAELGGRSLGPLLRVVEVDPGGPDPLPTAPGVGLAATTMPAEPGASDVRVSLTARWMLDG